MTSESTSALSPEERKTREQEAAAIKDAIKGIKNSLNSLNDEKEKHFETYRKVREQLMAYRKKSNELKKKRDTFTKEVKELKKKRDEINKALKEKADQLKAAQTELDSVKGKLHIKESPMQLRQQMERLDERIETEALPFDQEKKIMKQINALKAKLKETESLSQVFTSIRTIEKEITALKQEGKSQHLVVQKKAADSQVYHEELIALYKTMDELRPREKEEHEAFMKLKERFSTDNSRLKVEIAKLKDIQKQLGNAFEHEEKERRKKETRKLKDLEMEVEEKIKKRKKLTVEDILIFQKTSEKEEQDKEEKKDDNDSQAEQ
ncbi:MAG: hypothetical protein GXP63_05245 [DPANN group archaeon]|nr:hypothetical protein [DPANN group archaeon]